MRLDGSHVAMLQCNVNGMLRGSVTIQQGSRRSRRVRTATLYDRGNQEGAGMRRAEVQIIGTQHLQV
jgi:hypothetical protein